MNEKEYTITELTKELGICKMTAYKLLRSGRIKARKKYGTTHSGDTWLVSQSSVDEYREQRISRCAYPKIMWIETKCENCGNKGDSIFITCSNCNAVLYNKSYNENELTDKTEAEKIAIKETVERCPVCKAKIKK